MRTPLSGAGALQLWFCSSGLSFHAETETETAPGHPWCSAGLLGFGPVPHTWQATFPLCLALSGPKQLLLKQLWHKWCPGNSPGRSLGTACHRQQAGLRI